ncbi:bifunctional diaminohydroxyphosphoribosylaminopyrimidine deaminase/5-amino-6-(5-phosphoribosylamino)uracil reductase RibD [Ignavibacteria bacterium 4148-Me]|uniref:bifunctional diaminohydroxyphosphoribosylaminopyrimidine deaminase/5-amino-6-(5-phosphoribosylamino)uracil reductase RibD n=1 Tax=Rosettibacter primus TaxID=3111523 RepID=UPI00336BFF21
MELDKKYLEHCLELALKGKNKVEPNPLVGAVIVKDGKILSEGWHEYFGGPHAEANAIKNAKEELEGSTLYCNLEPCSHTDKKTPPCVPLIIKNKISRVVICTLDPNPKVNGNGVKQLQEAGIIVDIGVLENEARELNKKYFEQFIKKNV